MTAFCRTGRNLVGMVLALAVACFGSAQQSPAAAQEPFAGKTIELIVANTVGGGYDQYARVIARHMGKHLPGRPSFVVRNMPGAGGARAANHLFNIAPRDGTTIALFTREVALAPLLAPNPAAYQFKAREFNWIGSPQQDLGLMIVSAKSPAQTIDEMKSKPAVMSGTGPGSGPSMFPLLLNAVLGTKLKVVPGYPGSQEALLAVENGEVDGHVSGGSSAAFRGRINPLVEKGELKVLLQLGMTRDPDYAAPLVLDIVKDEKDRQLLELAFTPQYLGRPLAAPPGLPPGLVTILRDAFDATMKDADFLAEANAQKLDLNPVKGSEIESIVARVYDLPDDLIRRASSLGK
jgi:tripartite-type tricarboxylate transporter receptor subunit TctC